jgi:hypothetical protein
VELLDRTSRTGRLFLPDKYALLGSAEGNGYRNCVRIVKALFIPDGDSYSIELIAETQEEREALLKYWNCDSMAVTCEEWRDLASVR